MMLDTEPSPVKSEEWEQSRQTTLAALLNIDDTEILKLSRLTLPEIQAIKQEIARILPAGNLPAFILSGLLKLKGRRVSPDQVRSDLTALLRGIDLIPRGLYGALVAGPAAILYAYQKILRLSGKDLESAFPEGAWQFYLQFGLREDLARHANETIGFHRALSSPPHPIPMAGAWVCAALELVFNYDALLLTDWTERVMLRLLIEEATEADIADQPPFATLSKDWNRQRPYRSPTDSADYLSYRQELFQNLRQEWLQALPEKAQERFNRRFQERQAQELSAYQRQMTILAALEPNRYQEHRQPIPIWQAAVAFVWQGYTYLLPACQRDEQGSPLCYPPRPENAEPAPLFTLSTGSLCDAESQPLQVDRSGQVRYQDGRILGNLRPPAPETVLGWLAAIFNASPTENASVLDLLLAESPRSLQPELRGKLPADTLVELTALRRAPILVNWDRCPHDQPLAHVRRGRRGIGDHALTIFRTDRSFVFDQSHIFFDGVWGMAVAEILTHTASRWYRTLTSHTFTTQTPPPRPLALRCDPETLTAIQSHRQKGEAAAESGGVDMRRLNRLRNWLRQRGVHLTVNDLLLLCRFLHAAAYRPSPTARQALESFRSRAESLEARAAWQTIEVTLAHLQETNPALLVPMSASNVAPGERVFPTTFRNPLIEIRESFAAAYERHGAYSAQPSPDRWQALDQSRRELLAYLKAFGELLDTLKAVTMRGESFNTATIRLLAHLPPSMQHLLDGIPQRIGVLNEIIKGNEVFSNVGRVAPGSSLTRFTSAKDDGATKQLIWGILTDDRDQMHVSLRDFRPFVPQLLALGEEQLANLLAQDYLNAYVQEINRFAGELSAMITAEAPR